MSRELRKHIVRYANALHRNGWVANHDGNLTARLGPGRYLATPTATSKEDVSERNLLEVDEQGNRIAGTSRRFSEINLHLAVYRARPDVGAVVHAHPPNATAIACTGSNLIERPFLAEAIVSIGPEIPLLPFSPPGKPAAVALEPFVERCDAVLLGNHGVLTWGATIELAYLRMELVEQLASIAIAARPLGGTRPLPDDTILPLLEARAKAGLGKAADMAVERYALKSIGACAPAPHSNVRVTSPKSARADHRAEIESIIREEIVRSLTTK